MKPTDPTPPSRGKPIAALFSIAVLTAMVWPIRENLRAEPRDDFPLSYYPMFTTKRDATEKVTCLVGLDAAGERHKLRYRFAGGGGLNQVRRQIRRLVNGTESERLGQAVAARVARREDAPYNTLRTVLVVTQEYHLDDYFTGNPRLISETIHASCPVPRP